MVNINNFYNIYSKLTIPPIPKPWQAFKRINFPSCTNIFNFVYAKANNFFAIDLSKVGSKVEEIQFHSEDKIKQRMTAVKVIACSLAFFWSAALAKLLAAAGGLSASTIGLSLGSGVGVGIVCYHSLNALVNKISLYFEQHPQTSLVVGEELDFNSFVKSLKDQTIAPEKVKETFSKLADLHSQYKKAMIEKKCGILIDDKIKQLQTSYPQFDIEFLKKVFDKKRLEVLAPLPESDVFSEEATQNFEAAFGTMIADREAYLFEINTVLDSCRFITEGFDDYENSDQLKEFFATLEKPSTFVEFLDTKLINPKQALEILNQKLSDHAITLEKIRHNLLAKLESYGELSKNSELSAVINQVKDHLLNEEGFIKIFSDFTDSNDELQSLADEKAIKLAKDLETTFASPAINSSLVKKKLHRNLYEIGLTGFDSLYRALDHITFEAENDEPLTEQELALSFCTEIKLKAFKLHLQVLALQKFEYHFLHELENTLVNEQA